MNVTDPIRRHARLNPAAIAVIRADHAGVSYREFDQMIDAAATYLGGLGIVAGQTAGLAMSGPEEFRGMVVALALARLGVATADLALPAERMDVGILEAGRQAKPGVRSVPIEQIWASLLPPEDTKVPLVRAHPDGSAIFRIFGSSGTTGVAKFSAISHDLMSGRVMDTWRAIGLLQHVHICAVGMGITWGCTQMLRTLWSGGTLVLTNPAQIVADIRRHRVGSMAIAPVTLQKVVAAMPDDAPPLPSLSVVEVSGSALPSRLRALTQQTLCSRLFSHYGATEAGGIASGPFAMLGGDPRVVGHVHPGVTVQAVDADDRPLPPGVDGMLRIRSANCVDCYFGDAAGSADVFRNGWFYCGDSGAVSDDGVLTISGRTGDFINAGGNKVAPQVIEDVLLSLPQVTDAAAFGVPDSMGAVQIWAAIVADTRVETGVLSALCRKRLAEKSPKFILQVKALPRNANGKVVRDELVKFAMTRQR